MESQKSTISLITVIAALILAIVMAGYFLSRHDAQETSTFVPPDTQPSTPPDDHGPSMPQILLPEPPPTHPTLRTPLLPAQETLVFGFTEPVAGYDIVSTEWGNDVCREQLGDRYQWTEFHVTGGWVARGAWIHTGNFLPDRAWGWINDQPAECYETGVSGLTGKLTQESPDRLLVSWQVGEANANPYSGDTSCAVRMPLLCHRLP